MCEVAHQAYPKMGNLMPSFRSLQFKGDLGFAYIWVLLSVALIGLFLTIAFDVDSTVARRDKEIELLAIGQQFREGLRRYQEASKSTDGVAAYPQRLQDLLEDTRSGSAKRHLRKLFVDPMTGKTEWGLLMVDGRIVGIHSLSNDKPLKQDGFDPEWEGFRAAERYSDWVFFYPDNNIFYSRLNLTRSSSVY